MDISRRGRVACGLLLLALGCASWPTGLRAQGSDGALLSEEIALQHGLVRPWWRQIDLDTTRDRVESITMQGDSLYIQSRRGTINALDIETGRTRWVRQVGSPDKVTSPVGASDRFAAAINGSVIYVFGHDDGKLVFEHKTVNVPGSGPGVTKTHVIVPTIRGIVEAYTILDSKTPPWIYGSTGRAMQQPFVSGNIFGWSTDAGYFYLAQSDPPKPRFRVEARDSIVAAPGYQPPFLYVGSLDGHVYKVHQTTGVISWRYSTGEPVDEHPMVLGDRLYVSTRSGSLYCVQAEGHDAMPAPGEGKSKEIRDGSELWRTSDVGRLLAASNDRLYGLDHQSRLVILRRIDGGYLDAMPTSGFDHVVMNDISDRILVCSNFGTVQCLHEVGLKKAVVHRHAAPAIGGAADAPSKGGSHAKGAAKKGADEDADAGKGGDDPFGGGGGKAAKKAPEGKKAAAEEDPFGGGGGKAAPKKAAEEDPFGGAPAAKDAGAAKDGAKKAEKSPFD